jgi:hypothetical protein
MKPFLNLLLLILLVLPKELSQASGSNPSPQARHGHRMAYDANTNLTILFGGKAAGNTYLNDTWAWDGQRWKLMSEVGPSPRAWFALAFDADRDVIVLHGGRDSTDTALSDTWTWNGTTWNLVSTRGPEGRDHHAMAYDPTRNHVLMFGGYNNKTRLSWDDTWAWDGQVWRPRVSAQKPGPRDAHELAFVPHLNELIVFGGMNVHDGKTTIWGDTWGWDGAQWHKRSADEEAGRSHFSMDYDGTCGCVLRFGGGDPSRRPVGGTWRFDENRWVVLSAVGPSARVDHAMVYDRSRQRVVLFGGYLPRADGSIFGDTWEWDGKRWERR